MAPAEVDEEDEDENGEDEDDRPEPPRVLIFATRKNVELLCESPVWFLDGTFKTAPNIYSHNYSL